MNKNLVKILSLGTVLGIALTACEATPKDEKYVATGEFTVAYTIGSAEELKDNPINGDADSEKAVYDAIVNKYTTNSYGNFGGMVLGGEKQASGKYKEQTITPSYVCMSHQSVFVTVEEGYVDPISARCYYTRGKDGTVKFYSTGVNTSGELFYTDFVWGASSYSMTTTSTLSLQTLITDESIKIENGVMTAVFSVNYTVNSTPVVSSTFTTTWNLSK